MGSLEQVAVPTDGNFDDLNLQELQGQKILAGKGGNQPNGLIIEE